ncbi:Serine aminopeptidase, S33-type [Desulfonema limicola]|uniref:Serine aminopeptidase, S33-type n=1 Tax=Desulfonema limicola TaxID=45656 RepID=A0A975GH80_9BACT|nr:alpha/beta hydrolase [Desulfonema limicola]QTA81131.1 Serine aminopeptidase, S33-type [Desulfonema limicola]
MEKTINFLNHQGEKLSGTLHEPEISLDSGSTDTALILGHCFTCSRHTSILKDICKNIAAQGFSSLRFDFSGNGQSEGDFSQSSYTKHIKEMKQAVSFLRDLGIKRFCLGGHSMGAAIAVLTALQTENITGVCTLAGRLGSSDLSSVFTKEQLSQIQETGIMSFKSRGRSLSLSQEFFYDMQQYNLPGALKSLKIPLMVVHGDKDEIIPVQHAFQARELKHDLKLEIIPDADHMFMNQKHRALIADSISKWFMDIIQL